MPEDIEVVAAIPGAEMKPSADGQVAVRFNLAARKAVEDTPHTAYVEKFEASDNLRWSLGGGVAAVEEKPLGPAAQPPVPSTGSSGSASGASAGGS